IDAQLEAVVQKALSPEPSGRYATTEDFARALQVELTRLVQPSRKQVGDWVKMKCSEAYEANQRLLSMVGQSAASAPAPIPLQLTAPAPIPLQLTNPAQPTTAPSRKPLFLAAGAALVVLVAGGGLALQS